jgi:acid phosphatase type 7
MIRWKRQGRRTARTISFAMLLFSLTYSYAQDYETETTPRRIILNLTTLPSTSMAVTWRTKEETKSPMVEVAEATDWTQSSGNARTINAKTERVLLNYPIDSIHCAYYYSVVVDGLKPNTLYAYRVGAGSEWSEWSQFRTAESNVAPFRFAFFGDPQEDIKEHLSRVFRQAFATAPDASFWLFSGDITDNPDDRLLEELYYAAGPVFRGTPSILAPGNHDNMYKVENGMVALNKKGKKDRTKTLSPLWRGQFTLPENGISGFEESSYYVDYQGVRFVMMNSNDRLTEQALWLDTLLAHNPNRWTVVAFHHPLYSMGRERDERETRNAFLPVFDKYGVDLVLTGHDHAYARSYRLRNGVRVKDAEQGTVYVVSVSGPKAYEINSQYADLMAKVGSNAQLFQVIAVDGLQLKYESYTATGKLYDSFELTKK